MRKHIVNIVTLSSLILLLSTILVEAQIDQNKYFFSGKGHAIYGKYKLLRNSVNQLQNTIVSIPIVNANRKFDDILRMDSIITSSIQGGSFKVLFEYNVDEYITEQLILNRTGNGWFNSFLDYFYYDGNGNLLQDISLGWHNSHWDSLSQINYTYNPQGEIFQYIFQNYIDDNWVNVTRSSFEYDSSGNETVFLSEEWVDGDWNNKFMFNSYYSDLNTRDSLLFHIWDNIEWQNYSKTFFHYNALTHFLDYFVAVLWTGSSWQNYLRRKVVNDSNGNQIEQLEEIWNNNSWENSVRRFYTYNDLNYIEDAYSELWFENNWVSGDDVILIENPDGYKIGFITHSVTIYYMTVSSIEHVNSNLRNFVLEQNYPNPFNPSTSIQYTISSKQFVSLRVYDVLGNEIVTLAKEEKAAGNYEVNFDASGLPSGIYFYKLTAGSFTDSKKMILLK